MWQFAEKSKYELAAKYRDLHKTVLALGEQQKMATTADRDVDIFGFYREGPRLALQLFTMREGRIVGRREFFWEDLPEDDAFNASEFLGEVLAQYYSTDYVPLEIHVPARFRGPASAGESSDRTARTPRPDSRPETRAETPAGRSLSRRMQRSRSNSVSACSNPIHEKVLEELQELLELSYFPERIESFDISNISGAENVAGIVVFENGKPARSEYRRFIIKTVEGANDFASMNEAVFRRYKRSLDEEKPLPQVVFIDGGKGPAFGRRGRDADARSRSR